MSISLFWSQQLYRFRCTNNSVLNSAIVWHNVKFYIPVQSLCLWWVDCQLSQTLRSGKSIYFVTTVFWLLLMLATQFQVCSFYKINAWPHSPFTNHIFRLRWNEHYNNIRELEFYPSLQWFCMQHWVFCMLCAAYYRRQLTGPQSWLESVRDPEPDNTFVELYDMTGLRGVYIASTVVEGVYLIKVN